ncbi:MAG: nitroreductase family protein [Sulfuricellaceae bacterium]|nr:nitroreductase family protein [Sulfuricellaceae bacterium]
MEIGPLPAARALAQVLDYHRRSKHRLERYAAGPDTLDWSEQPNPFREFAGAPRIELPLRARELETPYAALYQAQAAEALALGLASIGSLLQLSFAISAWKEYGPDRWALRSNPSSGNLHPTEAYLVCAGVPGLEDGVYHYLSRDHALELRCRHGMSALPAGTLLLGLSSIHWREAWKYGERAFRYCQLDLGHALGALRYAAAALGWQAKLLDAPDSDEIAAWLGLDRPQDFAGAEAEEADLLLALTPLPGHAFPSVPTQSEWFGKANTLDRHPMYRWPVIDEVAIASRKPATLPAAWQAPAIPAASPHRSNESAAEVILRRRSAQRFDSQRSCTLADFSALLDRLLPRAAPPWDVWWFEPRVHPVIFVHRVEGLEPGLYLLLRDEALRGRLQAAMRPEFRWSRPGGIPGHLPLFLLQPGSYTQAARSIGCHQAIAADSCFALGMLAEFADVVQAAPWRYRQLYWEAGLLGQALYLEAEAAGLRGTGIGCFFDDAFHELLGLADAQFQCLYHFTVGHPLSDGRITTLPPYPERDKPKEPSP